LLQRSLLGRREPVNPRRKDTLDGVGKAADSCRPREPPGSIATLQGPHIDQAADQLFEEERVALGPVEQGCPKAGRNGVRAEEGARHLFGVASRSAGSEIELVSSPASPKSGWSSANSGRAVAMTSTGPADRRTMF